MLTFKKCHGSKLQFTYDKLKALGMFTTEICAQKRVIKNEINNL
jgi:hypothetical protein